jgi:hypothetical protein
MKSKMQIHQTGEMNAKLERENPDPENRLIGNIQGQAID